MKIGNYNPEKDEIELNNKLAGLLVLKGPPFEGGPFISPLFQDICLEHILAFSIIPFEIRALNG